MSRPLSDERIVRFELARKIGHEAAKIAGGTRN